MISERSIEPCQIAEMLLEQVKDEDEALQELYTDERPLLALVAHDNMKPLMASFARSYKSQLGEFRLTGTGTTCQMLKSIGLTPENTSVPSGPLGGDQVLGGMIAAGDIKALFFFRDPLSAHAHIADIEALSRLADVYQIYFSSNYRTAAAVLENLHTKLVERRRLPVITGTRRDNRTSVMVPEGMEDLGNVVQDKYKQNRQAVVDAAANDKVAGA